MIGDKNYRLGRFSVTACIVIGWIACIISGIALGADATVPGKIIRFLIFALVGLLNHGLWSVLSAVFDIAESSRTQTEQLDLLLARSGRPRQSSNPTHPSAIRAHPPAAIPSSQPPTPPPGMAPNETEEQWSARIAREEKIAFDRRAAAAAANRKRPQT